jgi:DNA-directed RNA polymerase alpha subunit
MGVERQRLDGILERALAELRAGADEAAVRAHLEDAIRACSALARDREDHTEYVLACRSRGMTLATIAAEIGLSSERVRAIAEVGRRLRERAALEAAEGPIAADSSVDRLDLPVHARNALHFAGIKTIGALAKLTDRDLLGLRNFGRASIRAVRRELERVGIRDRCK